MTREEAVIILDGFKNNPLLSDTHAQALDMALASLKADEAYQLEYENRDFVEIHKGMTNGEMLQTLFPNCMRGFDEEGWAYTKIDGMTAFSPVFWNAPYQKGGK